MGIGLDAWRAAIGTFSMPPSARFKRGHVGIVIHSQHVSLALKLCMVALLVVCGSVERNPGPGPSRDNTPADNTRHKSTGNTKTLKDYSGFNKPNDDKVQATILKELREFKENYEKTNKELKQSVDKLTEDITQLRTQVGAAQKSADEACAENEILRDELDQTRSRLDHLEAQSRRDNLIFHGITQDGDREESWDECENKVREFVTDKLDIDGDELEFERVHRLKSNKKNPSPIIAKFSRFKQRSQVLDAAKKKLKRRDKCGVTQDFTKKVRDIRKLLIPFMTEARNNDKHAYLSYDKLIIDKVKYSFDDETNNIKAT